MSLPEHSTRVILDTDIGTDVDDCLALAFLLGSPEFRLEAITTVYGNVALRARMCRKLLALRGRDDVPVHEGVRQPLMSLEPVYWPGHEGKGLLDAEDDPTDASDEHAAAHAAGHAVDVLIDRVMAAPGEITVLAVGPLTNIAAAIIREPSFTRSVARLTIMGGHISTHTRPGPLAEHNIKCDPEAAHVVFSSGAPIDLIPLDVTLRATIDAAGVERIRSGGTPYYDAIADQVALYPPFTERGERTFLHDPLAAASLLRPDHLAWHDLAVQVELSGRLTRAMTIATAPGEGRPATAHVALDLDRAACEELVIARIAGEGV